MKISPRIPGGVRLAVAFLLAAIVLAPAVMMAQVAPKEKPLPNFDTRTPAPGASPAAGYKGAQAALKTKVRGLQVDLDGLTQTPKFIRSQDGLLTGPNGEGGAVSASSLQAFSIDDPDRSLKAFLNEHSGLFGFNASALSDSVKNRDATGLSNGLRTVVWQQQLDGIPVFEGVLIANVSRGGGLVSVSSQFIPAPAAKADAGMPNRAAIAAQPPVSSIQAVIKAYENLNESVLPTNITSTGAAAVQGSYLLLKISGTKSAYARQVWVPMNNSAMRLCWEVIIDSGRSHERFQELVDAETGSIIRRQTLTEYISPATYRVYLDDSPAPFTPGPAAPSNFQAPLVPRGLVTISALSTNASPNGWINDGDNQTIGNNVDARLDRNFDGLPDGPQPTGTPNRVFDFPLDLTQDPITYTNAAIVNMFYWCNWYHDRLYDLGFTEAAGNFQTDNFGRGGAGNDALQANAQSGADVGQADNAFFSGGPDGIAGSVNMFVFSGVIPNRDGDLDQEVILHEATHGTSTRLVGGGIGISALQTAGMGEGWSDFFGTSLLSQPADDVDGTYPTGGYVTFQLAGLPFVENYYFGIRRYPYCTDLNKNPLTFKDIDPGQISPHFGVPLSPIFPFDPQSASEVHNEGEVWCMMLWEARAKLVKKYGNVGNQMMMQLAIDGMKVGPANPDFVQARDAIILADLIDNGGANFGELWSAFAKRGLGVSATSPGSSTTSGVVESFDLPGLVFDHAVISGGNGNGAIDFNECNDMSVVLRNTSPNSVNTVSARLTTTTPGAFVTQSVSSYPSAGSGAFTTNILTFKLSTASNFVCGLPVEFDMVIKSDQDTRTNHFRLPSGSQGAPVRFDNNVPVPIPDANLTGVNSPMQVSGITGTIGKVTVALHITHAFDSDLTMYLIAPDGTSNLLSSHNGIIGANYGVDCTDGNRTVFDDSAAIPITGGTPPFLGLFRPQQPLSVYAGKSGAAVNGTWQLHVYDDFVLDSGIIQCWSLFLSPTICVDGGGRCPGIDTALGMVATPSSVIVGSNLTYTITLTNNGPDIAKGVSVNQTIPPGVTFISGSASQGSVVFSAGQVTASLGSMNLGATATVTVHVIPTIVGTVLSTATVGSIEPDFDPSNNSVTTATQVIPPTADLEVGLVGSPAPLVLGGVMTYTASVTNHGPVSATSSTLTVNLPANVVFVAADSSQGGVVPAGAQVLFNLGTLDPGGVAIAIVHVRGIAVGGITATASVASPVTDPVPGNNSASFSTTVTPSSDLFLTMSGNPVSVVLGSNITYNITVSNLGPSAATGVIVNDTLPAGVTFVSASGSQGTTNLSPGAVSFAFGTIGVGATANGTVVVNTGSFSTNQVPLTLSNIAVAVSAQADVNPANNTAVATNRVDIARPAIVPAGASLVSESIAPPDGFIDPGETVTINLRLQNIGNRNTTNLVATLLATNGVTPADTQVGNYGALQSAGLPVSRPFTFTAATNGSGITAVLQLQDGATSLGSVQFAFSFPSVTTFANSGDISIPDSGPATPYPSTINVSGVSGLIGKVAVTMTNVNHTFPDDVTMLLVGPAGQKALLMSHTGDGNIVSNVSLTFDDGAPGFLPASGQITTGTYKPTQNGPTNTLPPPAPAQPFASTLSIFNGTNANGTWSLFVHDGAPGDHGIIVGGWKLAITAGAPVNQGGDVSITGTVSPNPIQAGNGNITYTFSITNNGPGTSSSVAFTNVLPAGVTLVSQNTTQGTIGVDGNGAVYCLLGSLGVGTNVTVTIVVTPTVPGTITNTASVTTLDGDLNQSNNSATVLATVNAPSADLQVGFSSTPSPAATGNNLIYTITVTNNGPGTAYNVVVSNGLGTMTFSSGFSSPPTGIPFVTNGAVFCNLGNLASDASASVVLTVVPTAVGVFTNVARATTLSTDPVAGNNSASGVITVVNPSPNVVSGGARLLTESFAPPNGTIDNGESVTISFTLTNSGTADAANVVATLLATNGVSAPSAPQNYGSIIHGGAAVSRSFTFTGNGTNGGVVSAILQLQDGSTNLGNIVFNFSLPAANTFGNAASITIPESGPATPYPSIINVSGVSGLVTKVSVTLSNLTHGFPDDLDILLVGPSGQKTILMSDAGGAHAITNVTLTFDAAAGSTLSDSGAIAAGTYLPVDYEAGDLFAPSAPPGPYVASLGTFNGSNPNGNWLLYVFDDTAGDSGSVGGGWSLNLTTVNPVNPAADLGITLLNPAGPLAVGSNFSYTITVTNKGPTNATGVSVTDTLPPGTSFVSTSLTNFSNFVSGLTFNIGNLNAGSATTFTLTVHPALSGNFFNSASVTANQFDLNSADNVAQVVTSILPVLPARLQATSYVNGQFTLTLSGQEGQSYVVEASTNLHNWTSVYTNVVVGGSFQYTDTNAGNYRAQYYRARSGQ